MATETALKFVLVGDSNVGKSQLSYRFCKQKFNVSSQSTVGIEFATRTIAINDYSIKAQLWDTAGQERFESMTRAYFRNSVGAILVYDVTKRQSFESIKNTWIPQLQEFGHENMYMIIVGNKFDIDPSEHVVRQVEAAEFAESQGLDFVETSAKSGLNVENAFRRAIVSVARLLPHVKESLASSNLPDGWVKLNSNNSKVSYQNIWTAEKVNVRPTEPAKTGMIVNCLQLKDEDVTFRDSSKDHFDPHKLRKLKEEVSSSKLDAEERDTLDLGSNKNDEKAESSNCLFSQCNIL